MDIVYKKAFEVQLNEINHHGFIKLSHIFNYFQNIASEQSAHHGISVTDLVKKNLMAVVTRYHLKITRYPRWRENIAIHTWCSGEKGLFTHREFEVVDANKKPLILATGSFTFVDLKQRKAVSARKYFPEFPLKKERVLLDNFEPMAELACAEFETSFQVRKHDIDFNKHVNNTFYVEWALESMPDNFFDRYFPDEIEIAYRGQASYGDLIISQSQLLNEKPCPSFLHKITREKDGKELTRVKTSWVFIDAE